MVKLLENKPKSYLIKLKKAYFIVFLIPLSIIYSFELIHFFEFVLVSSFNRLYKNQIDYETKLPRSYIGATITIFL